jgi:hypothetical protein
MLKKSLFILTLSAAVSLSASALQAQTVVPVFRWVEGTGWVQVNADPKPQTQPKLQQPQPEPQLMDSQSQYIDGHLITVSPFTQPQPKPKPLKHRFNLHTKTAVLGNRDGGIEWGPGKSPFHIKPKPPVY